MKKLIALFFTLLFALAVNARSVKSDLNAVISDSGISKNSISVSIKNLNTGKPLFNMNEKILMHPASVQKILTLPPAMDVLGENYEFSTAIYKRGNDSYVIKLGADPFFDYSDLKKLVTCIDKQTVQKIYIDDSIIDSKDWGEGWQWDDDLNVYMPRFSAYNLDDNLIKITVMPQEGKTIVINPSKYPIVFFNNVQVGNTNKVTVSRDSSISSNTLTLSGTVSKPYTCSIPVKNLKRYFYMKLTQALESKNIYIKAHFESTKLKPTDVLITKISHPIQPAENEILKNSNNMISETVGKLAANKTCGAGTDTNAVKLYNSYYEKLGLDYERIRLVDSSGVSKNNLVDADFITEYLIKSKNNTTLSKMAIPGEGTLENRMIPMKEDLRAKTGTLSDISSIAGYLNTKNGNKYVFCIIINDPKSSESEKKNLEDYLLREVYLKK
ncbi:D-alanyl-D-alanine carboxypeptidase/D-alanyl-D-alanine-endopeptidase [bacterium]|nr:D-alanyl-D-alanine carboxypeptidase/D-alanyl-D-alanine-endopeptidase [bacterium]